MSPKFSNLSRRIKRVSGTGPTLSLILTLVLLCVAVAVMKGCSGSGRVFAPAVHEKTHR